MSDDSMAPEVQALIEKINSLETRDSSYQRAKRLYENGDFTDSERNALGVALKAVKRRETLIEAMRIVINDKEDAAEILAQNFQGTFDAIALGAAGTRLIDPTIRAVR